jgi:hypothetical protein
VDPGAGLSGEPSCHTWLMNQWGADGWGDPCRECGYQWDLAPEHALAVIAGSPRRFAALLGDGDGTGRNPDLVWDAREYVAHVADNLRIWAERLSALTPGVTLPIAPYDQDVLAAARGYRQLPAASVLWSVGQSAEAFVDLWGTVPSDARLDHPESGTMDRDQVLVQVAHDTAHHLFDVERSV